jgi:hypothetical protein
MLVRNPEDDVQLASKILTLLGSYRDHFLPSSITSTVEQYQWPTVLQRYEQILIENSGK